MTSPPGWTLKCTLRAHRGRIGHPVWSRDGSRLATPGTDGYLIVWDAVAGNATRLIRHEGPVACAAFSPDGSRVVTAFEDPQADVLYTEDFGSFDEHVDPLPPEVDELLGDYSVSSEWQPDPDVPEGVALPLRMSEASSGKRLATLHAPQVRRTPTSVDWSPDGRYIATASYEGLGIWQARTGALVALVEMDDPVAVTFSPEGEAVAVAARDYWVVIDHVTQEELNAADNWYFEEVVNYTSLAWSSRDFLALGMEDGTVEICAPGGGTSSRFLEGHTRSVTSVSFSADGRLLATKALDGTVRLWECDTWEALSVLPEPARGQLATAGVAFSPVANRLATLGPAGRVVQIWHLDMPTLAARRDVAPTTHYANAKVVLVGDSGVGKTGLGLVLAGQKFRATESSHGRSVWLLGVEERAGAQPERREIYLWDLAGQPGYRILHQLHLADVAVAIVVFDAKSEIDPFSGVEHWVRALRQAHRPGEPAIPRILVAARLDRGGPAVSDDRIEALIREYGFSSYFQTSAKEGWGVEDLDAALRALIDWDGIPRVSSTGLFDSIKSFLVAERDRDRLLVTTRDLELAYASTQDADVDIHDEFETCIGRVAARGLIRRLSFGGLVLLRPEVLDAYAAALINAARDQPDGTGSISEDVARNGDFPMPEDERIQDEQLEKLLLAATVEEVLRHEVALREHSDEGPYLVFPTQSRREAPTLEEPDRVWLTVRFDGPVQHVYATLVVRIAHSGVFERIATYRNAATFKRGGAPGRVGFLVAEEHAGQGEIRLFSSDDADESAKSWFADYVVAHIQRRAIADSMILNTAVRCGVCGFEATDQLLELARARGMSRIRCPVCESSLDIRPGDEASINEIVVRQMDASADHERNRAAATAALRGKEQVGEFDVFLAHNSVDKEAAARIAENLRGYGLNPWLDEEQIPPGRWFQDAIEAAMGSVHSAAIIIGKSGLGKWEAVELKGFIAECVDRELPVIPVLLPGAEIPSELRLLQQLAWVRFRDSIDDQSAIDRLEWGITAGRTAASST